MANWRTIEELRNIFIQSYTESKRVSELENACNREYELKMGYNGRQILELLQNVDDAYERKGDGADEEVIVKIVFKNNILEVGNTGTFFSQETIERLCEGGASNKSSENIGNKGTGFRSLLNDAEWIEVHSGEFSVKFSEDYAKAQFEKCKSSPVIGEQLRKWQKEYDLCFPVMHCPEQIEKCESEFDTLIRVKVSEENENKATSIRSQLKQPFYKSLLFLPNITKIVITIDDETETFKKGCVGKRILLSDSKNTLNTYFVEKKKVGINGKKADLIVAVPLDEGYDFSNEKLYCYFPIRDCKTPVHALIHAPFETNTSRDDIRDGNAQTNVRLLEECLKFLKEIAETVAADKSLAEELAVKTVTPTHGFSGKVWDEDAFNLKQAYIELLADAKILPTVNGEYISANDAPKCLKSAFPEEFKGEPFKALLPLLPDEAHEFVKDLVEKAGGTLYYTEEELAEKINALSSGWSVPEQVKIFLWWSENYRVCQKLPHLLKDTTGQWLEESSAAKIYLPTGTEITAVHESLPWVDLRILSQAHFDAIVTLLQAERGEKWEDAKQKSGSAQRVLDKYSELHFPVQFSDQSNLNLIFDEINEQVTTPDRAVSFIRWFYDVNKNQKQESAKRFDRTYKLPDRAGNLREAEALYFGKEYGQALAEKIFDSEKYFAVASFETLFEGYESERKEVLAFLEKCGVRKYPKIYLKEGLNVYSDFAQYIKRKYRYEPNINYLAAPYIDGFEQTLRSLETKEVTQWITEDRALYNLIVSRGQAGYYAHSSNSSGWPMDANEYILFTLNTTKWIEIEGKKYAPNDIVKYPKLKDKIDGIYGISEPRLIEVLGDERVAKSMGLGFVPSLASFPDEVIQKILLKLHEVDNGGEISRPFYEDIIRVKKGLTPDASYSTKGFKVLATDGAFHDNTAVKYTRTKLPKAAMGSTLFARIPPKRSMETIESWLGIERYKMNLELLEYTPTEELVGFENEIADIRIVALAILEDIRDNNIQTVKRLKVVPCSRILVKDVENGNKEFELDDYNYVKDNREYYIKLPANADIGQMRRTREYITAITEIVEEAMERQINQDKFLYLLSYDAAGKKRIIDEDYGVDKWNSIHELLHQRSIVNEQVLKFFAESGLDEQRLNRLKKIDFSDVLPPEDFHALREALIEVGKDIQDINAFDGRLAIDITPCIAEEFLRYRNSKIDVYANNCYEYAALHEEAQATFLDDCDAFKRYSLDGSSIENSIKIDYDAILKRAFSKFNPSASGSRAKIDGEYAKNFEALLKSGFTPAVLDFYLQTHRSEKSILFFKLPEYIREDLQRFADSEKEREAQEQDDANGNEEPQKATIVETTLEPASPSKEATPQIKSEKSQTQYENESEEKEKNGKEAERQAYAALKKDFPNLIWHSKNSDIPADRHNRPAGITCDMWSTAPDGVITYFEVKSAVTEFEMSIGEYNSMLKAKENYYVVLVDIKAHKVSKQKFDALEPHKRVSKYKFRFKQVEKTDV